MKQLEFEREHLDRLRKQCTPSAGYWKHPGQATMFLAKLMGLKDLSDDPGMHLELFAFLESKHKRKALSGFRASFKTSCTMVHNIQVRLENPDTTTMLVQQKLEGATASAQATLEQMQHMMKTNTLFLAMYRDRIPNGFEGWNASRIVFNRTDPLAGPAFLIGSLDSRLESVHVDRIWCNDLEGADAELSDAPNSAAHFFIENRLLPLLKHPTESEVLVEGTPHGKRPLMHSLKNNDAWSTWWKPIHDENKKPAFPERFTTNVIAGLYSDAQRSGKARQALDQHYLLRKKTDFGAGFDIDRIKAGFYTRTYDWDEMSIPGPYYRYPVLEPDPYLKDEFGRPKLIVGHKEIHASALRMYYQFDPKHKDTKEMRGDSPPTTAALGAIGITPDFHGIVCDTWIKDTGDPVEMAEAYWAMYCKWGGCATGGKPIFEDIGAQIWFLSFLKQMEKMRGPYISKAPWNRGQKLAKISLRLETSKGGSKQKTFQVTSALSAWFDMMWLHLHESQTEGLRHFEVFPSDDEPVDFADMLAQGPDFWKPPISEDQRRIMQQRQYMMEMVRGGALYKSPFPSETEERMLNAVN